MHNCFMECKLSRESNVVGDKRGRGEKRYVRMVKNITWKVIMMWFPVFSYQCQVSRFQALITAFL